MKKELKYSLLFLLSVVVTEIVNGMIVFCLGKFLKGNEEYVIIFTSLLMYFILGRILFSKVTDTGSLRKAVFYASVTIMISYLAALGATAATGIYFIFHIMICSPVGNLLAYPFSELSPLYEVLLCVFSPVSVLLVWLFGRIKKFPMHNSKNDKNNNVVY